MAKVFGVSQALMSAGRTQGQAQAGGPPVSGHAGRLSWAAQRGAARRTMSSSTPSARSTYDGSRLALVHALPLDTATSCARQWEAKQCNNMHQIPAARRLGAGAPAATPDCRPSAGARLLARRRGSQQGTQPQGVARLRHSSAAGALGSP